MPIYFDNKQFEAAAKVLSERFDVPAEQAGAMAEAMVASFFEGVSPTSAWWLGNVATQEDVDVVYVKPKGDGRGLVMRNLGDGEFQVLDDFRANFSYYKDESKTMKSFHISQMARPSHD